MNSRQIAVLAGFVMVLGALVLLLVEVNASSAVEVPEDSLAQARARFERHQSAHRGTRPPPSPIPAEPSRTTPPSPARAESDDGARSARRPPSRRPGPSLDTAAHQKDESETPPSRVAAIRDLFDRGQYDGALDMAEAYLRTDPEQTYVRRVAVTSACALGDADTARAHYKELHSADQRIVSARCARFGFEF
jgi:hypothetical protein